MEARQFSGYKYMSPLIFSSQDGRMEESVWPQGFAKDLHKWRA